MTGVVVSVNVSGGGVPKVPVPAGRVTTLGIDGDAHRYHGHGGPDKALCLYAIERIEALRAEGHPIGIGGTGENLTVQGLPWDAIVPGVRLRVGTILVECTDWAHPCKTITGAFHDGRSGRISPKTHPGWSRIYARVLEEGTVRAGDHIEVIDT